MLGFDNDLYMKKQTEEISERIKQLGGKLYLEFGGKLFDDLNAARVMPGFHVNGKILLLEKMKEDVEIIICISSADIEKNKIRGDHGITYDLEVLRLVDSMRKMGFYIPSIVITMYREPANATDIFRKKLEQRGENVYVHRPIDGYPNNVDHVLSDKGFGANPHIKTTRKLVVVTAPGPGSGKLGTCLSQIYHERKDGIKAGYAKFETFPIWNLPLEHPVNYAYEAATADLDDKNAVDHFHLDAYGKAAVNYNRDIEAFPILKTIFTKLVKEHPYKSPTDMGVNMAGFGITDDAVVSEAAKQEIIRRYFWTQVFYKEGHTEINAVRKIEQIMKKLSLVPTYRPTVAPALEKSKKHDCPAMCLILPSGQVIKARTTDSLVAPSALVLNCVKTLAQIPDDTYLISPDVLKPMLVLKTQILNENPRISLAETLNALSICAATDALAKKALSQLVELRGLDVHSSHIISKSDEQTLKKLGINVTCSPEFSSKELF
ncbi:MAG: DUF1846 domain-containing protein [Christensenellaceae bacterium]|jgi:uncharacterized protein (UPF0371 family)|nr:DUF1846 domain-containing protein [Christensenellaceae bacterium]